MRNILKAAIVLLALGFLPAPTIASESVARTFVNRIDSAYKSERKESVVKTMSVGLVVEIPASRLNFRHHLEIPINSTVSQAVEFVYPVKHGVVCCDSRDIRAINGLEIDPYQEKWWVIKINGNMQNSSSQSKLKDGDVAELVYLEKEYNPTAHVRLEDWVK